VAENAVKERPGADGGPPASGSTVSVTEPTAIVGRFLDIYRYLNHYSRTIAHDLGISGRKLSALRFLKASDGAKIGELGDYLHISDSSTSELVSELEQRGLVRRQRCDADNRVVRAYVTPEAEELIARAPVAGFGLMREGLKSLPADERAAIAAALERLAELLGVDSVAF